MSIKISECSEWVINKTRTSCATNYRPTEVVFTHADGVWMYDVEGRRYLDFLSAYSAMNFGHRNRRFEKAAIEQLSRITLTSRAFYNDQLGPFCDELARLCGFERVIPMNSGAEAVETAIKIGRKWGYEVKGIPDNAAKIICLGGNFHGRTTTIISFSESPSSYTHFGPLTPGFLLVPFGDLAALEQALTPEVAAILIEPIQGEGGVIIPPDGYLKSVRELCDKHRVLFISDEIQTGLGRTGRLMACDHEDVKPDMIILGKSLGGGITPISAVVGRGELIDLLVPGTHGSTFGGNPFACAIGREVIRYIHEEKPHERAAHMGVYFAKRLQALPTEKIKAVRSRGLMGAIDFKPEGGVAKDYCKKLLEIGLVTYHTREQTMRLAPPLIITEYELDQGFEMIERVLK
jgi:ornithine--oxo-acid transaminase